MNTKTIEKILLEFDPETTSLLPALKKISADFGYISEKDALKIADYFRITLAKVYETASFYDHINVIKQPNLVIKVCSGANCAVNNSYAVIREIENYLKVKADDETDPKIKLEMISCLGQCGEGPIMVVNGKVFNNINTSSVHDIIKNYI
jgi:NADH:ubiquinone oxidoreductase subunit E